MNPETKNCASCKTAFTIEPDDFGFYEKMGVPAPTFCPECRTKRRFMFRNERTFYRRICDLCKKSIISTYPADAKFPVYCQKCFWSDDWDAAQYGRDFDFSRPFFDQFKELFHAVPIISIMNDDGIGSVNSEYAYDFSRSKNCYMTAAGWFVENGMYSYYTCYDKDIADCYFVNNSELCCECFSAEKCYRCKYCTSCFDCHDCAFSFDLTGCSDCVLSVGLRKKQYCIRNQQYSKEEYFQKLKELDLGNRDNVERYKQEMWAMAQKFPRKYSEILRSTATTGHVLVGCKNSKDCFFADNLENCRFVFLTDGGKDCYDCFNTGKPNFCYECVVPDVSYADAFDIFCWQCTYTWYSNNCHSSNNLFGCSGMKKAEYSILNKRYSKEEYEALRAKIIEHTKKTGEYGEFFPGSMSSFAYNETQAQEWFPLSKEAALAAGYSWKEPEERNYQITLHNQDVPKTLADLPADILEKVIDCAHAGTCNEKCTTAFRIAPQELNLYKLLDVPLPQLCPNCRYYERLKWRNPMRLWERNCQCSGALSSNGVYTNTVKHFHDTADCPNTFQTSFEPGRPEIMYCEQCYQQEVA